MSFLARFRTTEQTAPAEDTNTPEPVDLEPREYLRVAPKDAPLIDVRTPAEFHQLHLAGAHNVDILDARFMEGFEALGLDPDQPVYLYCRSGNRSGHAARMLRDRGYRRAFNVGGLEDLVEKGAVTGS